MATGGPRRDRGGTQARRADRTLCRECRETRWIAVFYVRIAETPLGDQANVLGYVGMGRTGPLAIDDFVKVLGVGGISRFHSKLVPDTFLHPANSPIPYLALA